MAETLLEVSDLRTGYGAGDILQGVAFSVAPGEVVAIVGRNGVGKTTLMKAVIGLLPALGGSIRFRGREISTLAAEDRARSGGRSRPWRCAPQSSWRVRPCSG